MSLQPAGQSLRFPRRFVWGVAAAAPQIEGAAFTDGKGPSIWDTFARQPGKVLGGDTLDEACDHYHRFAEDFALMRDLGVRHYRLSIAWPRISPDGSAQVNAKGVAFYHRLIDSMLEHGITPWVTMFHWDLPQALEDRGGWRVRSTADAFAGYARTLVREYGDRVKHWMTLNEIHCFTRFAYTGALDKAPGTPETEAVVNQSYHVALLAHGEGVRAVREHGGRGAQVGLADNTLVGIPVTESPADIRAAQAYFLEQQAQTLTPLFKGRYDTAFLRRVGRDAPKVQRGDMALISEPIDFLGQNVYYGDFVRAAAGRQKYEKLPFPSGYPCADAKWIRHTPQAIYWATRLARECYGVDSIYITENGSGYHDAPPVDGEVNDLPRRELARNYLGEVHRAIREGVPVRGYFHWSFMDNFEWAMGYKDRFGLVYVDFKTQERTPKLSARWYSQVMRENRLV